jgi:hypothetical protein
MRYLILFLIPFLAFGQGKATHGNSLYFDASGDYITIGNISTLKFKEKTIVVWVKPLALNAITHYMVFSSGDMAFYLDLYDGKEFVSYQNSIGGQVAVTLSSVNHLKINTWQMITISQRVPDADSVISKGYINGTAELTVNSTAGFASSYGTNYAIGQFTSGHDLLFYGYIRSVQYYHRVLSATEILWLFNHPDKIYSTDSLKGYWTLNEYTGTVAGDSSGAGNNGTIVGSTWSLDTPVKSGGN